MPVQIEVVMMREAYMRRLVSSALVVYLGKKLALKKKSFSTLKELATSLKVTIVSSLPGKPSSPSGDE